LLCSAALDTFVDYTWQDRTSLSMTIIVLLVVEVSLQHYIFLARNKCSIGHQCVWQFGEADAVALLLDNVSMPVQPGICLSL
jgi:hypothetical protein